MQAPGQGIGSPPGRHNLLSPSFPRILPFASRFPGRKHWPRPHGRSMVSYSRLGGRGCISAHFGYSRGRIGQDAPSPPDDAHGGDDVPASPSARAGGRAGRAARLRPPSAPRRGGGPGTRRPPARRQLPPGRRCASARHGRGGRPHRRHRHRQIRRRGSEDRRHAQLDRRPRLFPRRHQGGPRRSRHGPSRRRRTGVIAQRRERGDPAPAGAAAAVGPGADRADRQRRQHPRPQGRRGGGLRAAGRGLPARPGAQRQHHGDDRPGRRPGVRVEPGARLHARGLRPLPSGRQPGPQAPQGRGGHAPGGGIAHRPGDGDGAGCVRPGAAPRPANRAPSC